MYYSMFPYVKLCFHKSFFHITYDDQVFKKPMIHKYNNFLHLIEVLCFLVTYSNLHSVYYYPIFYLPCSTFQGGIPIFSNFVGIRFTGCLYVILFFRMFVLSYPIFQKIFPYNRISKGTSKCTLYMKL